MDTVSKLQMLKQAQMSGKRTMQVIPYMPKSLYLKTYIQENNTNGTKQARHYKTNTETGNAYYLALNRQQADLFENEQYKVVKAHWRVLILNVSLHFCRVVHRA